MKKILFFICIHRGSRLHGGPGGLAVYRGNVQRTAFNDAEQNCVQPASSQLELLWKRRLGEQALTAPAIVGRLITHRGFRS